MGTFAASISVYGATQQAVVQAFQTAFPDELAIVSAEVSSWVGLFTPDLLVDLNDDMRRVGSVVSRGARRPALGIRLIHSEILCYYAWNSAGTLVDSSAPLDEDDPTEQEALGLGGKLEAIEGLFGTSIKATELRSILERPTTVRDHNLGEFCDRLGNPWAFGSFEEYGDDWPYIAEARFPRKKDVVTLGFQFPSVG